MQGCKINEALLQTNAWFTLRELLTSFLRRSPEKTATHGGKTCYESADQSGDKD
jgi:hypothetical protein